MQPPRFSIAKLMTYVAIIAANLAVLRELARVHNGDWVVVSLPIWLAIHVGLWNLARRRGVDRAFWMGFLVCLSLWEACLLWIIFVSDTTLPARLLQGYLEIVHAFRMKWWWVWPGYHSSTFVRLLIGGIYLAVPQLLAATLIGFVVRAAARPRRSASVTLAHAC